MEMLTAICIAAFAWIATLGVLLLGLFSDKLPAEEGNMIFYLILQAAVPTLVFYYMTHQ